jgi:hypothetical protein
VDSGRRRGTIRDHRGARLAPPGARTAAPAPPAVALAAAVILHRPRTRRPGGRGGNSNEQQPLSLCTGSANDQQPTTNDQQPATQQPANQQPAKGEPGLARWEAGVPRAPPQSVALRTRTPAPAREASLRPQEGDSPTGVPVVSRSGSTMRCAAIDPPRSSPHDPPAPSRSPLRAVPPPVRMAALSPESHGWRSNPEGKSGRITCSHRRSCSSVPSRIAPSRTQGWSFTAASGAHLRPWSGTRPSGTRATIPASRGQEWCSGMAAGETRKP